MMRYTKGMHWELWAIPTMNLISARATESEALALVRELLAKGWQPNELSLIAEDDVSPAEDLPPALSGAELVQRATASGATATRRTA
jgi:hypothetical protein